MPPPAPCLGAGSRGGWSIVVDYQALRRPSCWGVCQTGETAANRYRASLRRDTSLLVPRSRFTQRNPVISRLAFLCDRTLLLGFVGESLDLVHCLGEPV